MLLLHDTLIILRHLRKSSCNSQAGIIPGLTPHVIPAFYKKQQQLFMQICTCSGIVLKADYEQPK